MFLWWLKNGERKLDLRRWGFSAVDRQSIEFAWIGLVSLICSCKIGKIMDEQKYR
jgi:hypothetical protein